MTPVVEDWHTGFMVSEVHDSIHGRINVDNDLPRLSRVWVLVVSSSFPIYITQVHYHLFGDQSNVYDVI